MSLHQPAVSIPSIEPIKYSTADFAPRHRLEWLQETIGREYANVEITPPRTDLFNEMHIYGWDKLRLSVIRSNAIELKRLPCEPNRASQDAYFAVINLYGNYRLQQNGREVYLKPGEMTLYDATLPHRIECPVAFSKLIVSIPRTLLKERVAGVEHCTALPISNQRGIGSVTTGFIRSCVDQASRLNQGEFSNLSEHALDLLALALAAVRPTKINLSRSRSATLCRVKNYIERNLTDPTLGSMAVSVGTGVSSRYINLLFNNENTSLMRYIWQRRLECCRIDMAAPTHSGHHITDIAFRWGFNDLSHFSRIFKKQFGCSPTEYRASAITKIWPTDRV